MQDKTFLNLQNVQEGAQPVIYAATEPGLEKSSGKLIQNCDLFPAYLNARNGEIRKKVLEQTLKRVQCEKLIDKLMNSDKEKVIH